MEKVGFMTTLSEIFKEKDDYHSRFYPIFTANRMSMDTTTALATFKEKTGIMTACIYKGKGKEDM